MVSFTWFPLPAPVLSLRNWFAGARELWETNSVCLDLGKLQGQQLFPVCPFKISAGALMVWEGWARPAWTSPKRLVFHPQEINIHLQRSQKDGR